MKGTKQRKRKRLLWALGILFVGHQFLSFHPTPVPSQLATTNKATSTMDDDDDHELDKAPFWSAYLFQHHRTDFNTIWHPIGNTYDQLDPKRYAIEVLTYGLAGVLPYYAFQLPALWFESPFGDQTRVLIIHVPQVTDAFLDLHHCKEGLPNHTKPDGTYDVSKETLLL